MKQYSKLIFIICVIVFLINLLLRKYDIRLNHNILDVFSVLIYISATILFFLNLKLKRYFRAFIFFIFPLIIISNLISNKQVERLFTIAHLNPMLQNNVKYHDKNLVIYYEINVSRDQKYDLYEKKYLIFEKKLDELIIAKGIKPYFRIIKKDKKYNIKYPKLEYNYKMSRIELKETFKIINL